MTVEVGGLSRRFVGTTKIFPGPVVDVAVAVVMVATASDVLSVTAGLGVVESAAPAVPDALALDNNSSRPSLNSWF